MIGYTSLNIICSSKLTVFLEALSRKALRLPERIMSAHKYPSIFSHQMKAIVSILNVVYYHIFYYRTGDWGLRWWEHVIQVTNGPQKSGHE